MTISPTSLAAVNGVGVKNEQFAVSASVLARKILIIGTYDASKTAVVANTPKRVYSADDVGSQTGFGFMLHRLASQVFAGSQGVEAWMLPQAEASGAAAASGSILFAASSALAGTLCLYFAGHRIAVNVTASETAANIATAVAAAINADKRCPVSATVNTATVTVTAKSSGPWGTAISIKTNLNSGEALPSGVTATITAMTGGSGVPDVATALAALGTGDLANDEFFTDVVHGYGQDSATLNAISTYNGDGDDFTGCYAKEVSRPFRALTGDVATGSAGLSALITLGDGRKSDRTNGVIAVPGSPNHPSEIAALAIGIMARINNTRAEETYIDVVLPGVYPGAVADQWTSDYDDRDSAVKAGISTTMMKSGAVVMQNMVTFYHPDSVTQDSNGYRAMRNISILQNLLYNYRANFARTKWQGVSIVADTSEVTDPVDREKARDIDSVLDDLTALTDAFVGKAWLYSDAYTKAELKAGTQVTLRSGLTGFDITFPVILSGEGGIYNSTIKFDTSIAVLM